MKNTTPKPKSIRGKKLTPKQAKFVKAKIEGKSGTEAAKLAYNVKDDTVASAISAENLRKPSIAEALQAEYERQGITLNALVKPLADGLKANRVVQVEGDFYETEVPDHSTRIKAAGMAAQWVGIGKEQTVSGGIHFHQHNESKQQEYEL